MKIEGNEYRTIWFENNVVKIIDQTKLPHKFIIRNLKTLEDTVNAIKIMQDLDAEYSFGMHWGTFTLTAEDTLEPRERLIDAVKINGIDNFKTLIPGEVIFLK